MNKHDGHGEVLKGFFSEQKQIFDSSKQGVYVFLDEGCIACNQKFADLLGYQSPGEWAGASQDDFAHTFVDAKSRATLVSAYQNAVEKMEGATIKVTWKKKGGGEVSTNVILVPVAYKAHVLALHFVSQA